MLVLRALSSFAVVVCLLVALPLAAEGLNGVSVTGTLEGSIRSADPLDSRNTGCSHLAFSITGAAAGAFGGTFSGSGTSVVVSQGCDILEFGAVLVTPMTFQITGGVTGIIRYSGNAGFTFADDGVFKQTLFPGMTPIVGCCTPNAPAMYEAMTPSGPAAGFVRFQLDAAGVPPGPSSATGTFVAFFESGDVPFSSITVKANLDPRGRQVNVKGDFTLGTGSNGIDPATEQVTLHVGDVAFVVPPGSFVARGGDQYRFDGVVGNAMLNAAIRPTDGRSFAFQVEVSKADLSGTWYPVTVGLKIGNDKGSVTVVGHGSN
jgi:hypothetical protein